jgi:ribose/xylose/arabinose/galactoside ABC-type transport system permease subunit
MSASTPPANDLLPVRQHRSTGVAVRAALARTESGLLAAIVVVLVLTTLLDSQHNYWHNPHTSAVNILRQSAFLGIFALGAAIVIIAGGIDLSSGSVIAFSGSVCAMLMALLAPEDVRESREIAVWVIVVAVLGTLAVGLLIGSFHAWLITVVRLPPFVATLATLVGLRSLARILMETVTRAVWNSPKTQIDVAADSFKYLTREFCIPVPFIAPLWTTAPWVPLFVFALLAVAAWVLMSRTVVGRHLHALGGNEQAARLSGIQTDRLKWLAYCISAVLASVAGILYVSDTTTANPQNLGRGYELNAIAAAVVGGCSLSGGVGTITGTVLGVVFLRSVIDGVAKIIKSNAEVYEGLIVGAVVVVAVALTQFRQAVQHGQRFFAGALGWVTIFNLALLAGVMGLVMTPSKSFDHPNPPSPLTVTGAVGGVTLAVLLLARFLEARRSGESKSS